jgi:hypothetical protein
MTHRTLHWDSDKQSGYATQDAVTITMGIALSVAAGARAFHYDSASDSGSYREVDAVVFDDPEATRVRHPLLATDADVVNAYFDAHVELFTGA